MKVLALDASSASGGIAFFDTETGTEGTAAFRADRAHTSDLFPLIEQFARRFGPADRLAVGLGPGSYAGVRVAISTALGLASAWDADLVGAPSVAMFPMRQYISIGDARRETYYWAAVADGVCLAGPELLDHTALLTRLSNLGLRDETDSAMGSGEIPWPLATSDPSPPVPPPFAITLTAPSALLLARRAVTLPPIAPGETLEPLYLREAHITQPRAASIPQTSSVESITPPLS
jgi:tRNA threonylcarbamoyladenosine biosynthesis protein TsaB